MINAKHGAVHGEGLWPWASEAVRELLFAFYEARCIMDRRWVHGEVTVVPSVERYFAPWTKAAARGRTGVVLLRAQDKRPRVWAKDAV